MIDLNTFASRHIGPRNEDIKLMLKSINCSSLDDLINKTVPSNILSESSLNLKPGMSEEFNKLVGDILYHVIIAQSEDGSIEPDNREDDPQQFDLQ